MSDDILPTVNRRKNASSASPTWMLPGADHDPERDDSHEDIDLTGDSRDSYGLPSVASVPTDFSTDTFLSDIRAAYTELRSIVVSLWR